MDIVIVIAQETDLKVLNQSSHLFLVQEQAGDGHHGHTIFRYPSGQIEFRQNFRRQDGSD